MELHDLGVFYNISVTCYVLQKFNYHFHIQETKFSKNYLIPFMLHTKSLNLWTSVIFISFIFLILH